MSVDVPHDLLCWYDVDKRRLPWRAESGETPDPYRVWLSEIMLQQTTVAAVKPYFAAFTERWPDVRALAAADDGDVMAAWAGLGYYARARNLLACARAVVAQHDGHFPDDEAALRALPGIGAYTAAAIAAIAFGRPAVAVDANVERVVARLFAVATPLPKARAGLRRLAATITPPERAGDFAQAMMDLGSAICTSRSPRCGACPIAAHCAARASGDPALYPVKAPKREKPRRTGIAYWLEHDGHVRLVRRPAKGLLGGMLALPTDEDEAAIEAGAGWEDAGAVAHVFTHFALDMRLLAARAARRDGGLWEGGLWWPVADLDNAGLPTLFRKLAERGLAWREP